MSRFGAGSVILLCIFLIISVSPSTTPDSHFSRTRNEAGLTTATDLPIDYADDWDQACCSVIVTGNATKDGRAILMKNRDWPEDLLNVPVYVPATSSKFAYIGVNTNTMGINEKGLAVMNTYLPALAGPEPIEGNLRLNQMILERYETVSEVANALNDEYSLIGPVYRSNLGSVATCIGVIDRYGAGAFFEVSDTRAYVQYVVDGYDSRANHPRIFPDCSTGPKGRDQYLLDVLDEVYDKYGYIAPEHVMQNVSRFVHHKELGSANFSIEGEVCNSNTVATMVAVSGDSRYGGMLNCMWTACGSNPLVGVFVPSMVCAETVPESIEDLWSHTYDNYVSARVFSSPSDEWLLIPERVREVQNYSFFAEGYSIDAYEQLMSSVPRGLSDQQIRDTVRNFIVGMDDYVSEIFKKETTDVVVPPLVSFPTIISATPSLPASPTSTSTTESPTSPTSTTSGESLYDDQLLPLSIGIVSGFTIVMIVAVIARRYT